MECASARFAAWTADHGLEDEMGMNAGGMLGLTERIAVGAHLSFLDEREGWKYASFTPHLLVDLTPEISPFRIAIFAGYEFGALDTTSHHSIESNPVGHHHGDDHGESESTEHMGESEHEESHEHSGVHRHGRSAWHARLIIEADLTVADKLVFNMVNLTPEDGKTAWGYAAGLRHSFTHDLAVGLEASGDFGESNEHILLAGGYFSPTHQLTLKIGAGIGLAKESPDTTVRLGAVWRF